MKPPDYWEIEAKVGSVRRRSLVRAATVAGILTGAGVVALAFYVFWPTDPVAQPPCSVGLVAMALAGAICGTLFRWVAVLLEWLRRLAAGRKPELPAPDGAAPAGAGGQHAVKSQRHP